MGKIYVKTNLRKTYEVTENSLFCFVARTRGSTSEDARVVQGVQSDQAPAEQTTIPLSHQFSLTLPPEMTQGLLFNKGRQTKVNQIHRPLWERKTYLIKGPGL